MDGQRFDELTRSLATGASRRRFLKGLAAGASVALFGRTTASAEEACPVALDLGEPCAAKVGICHRTGSATNPYRYINVCVDAAPAHAAHGDLVACPTNQVIDPETCTCICDPTITCGDGELLNPATCECECPAGTELCSGSCVPICPEGTARNPSTCQCAAPAGGYPAAGCPTGQKCCRTHSGLSACCPESAACCAGTYADGTEYLGCTGTCSNAPYSGCPDGCQPMSPVPGICCPGGTPAQSPGTCFCAGTGFACGGGCNCTRGGTCPYCCSGVCGSDGRCV